MRSSKRRQKSVSAKPSSRGFREAIFSLPEKPPLNKMNRAIKNKWLSRLKSGGFLECEGAMTKVVLINGKHVICYDPFGVLCRVYLETASKHKLPPISASLLASEVVPSFVREWAGISEEHRSCLEEIHDRWGCQGRGNRFSFAIQYIERYM